MVWLFIQIKGKRIKVYPIVHRMKEETEKVKSVLLQIFILCRTELLDGLLLSKEGLAQCKISNENQAGYACSSKQVC